MKRENGIQSPSCAMRVAMRSASSLESASASGGGGGSPGSAGGGMVGGSATLMRFLSQSAGEYSMQGGVVLVTGAARRIGAAIARELHRAGANVVLHYRGSRAEAEGLAKELNGARGDSAALAQADLLDLDAIPALVEQ